AVVAHGGGAGDVPARHRRHAPPVRDRRPGHVPAGALRHGGLPSPLMGDTVTFELDAARHVATITYNRPGALNAIDGEMRADLNAAFSRFRDDEDAWVAIVTGA